MGKFLLIRCPHESATKRKSFETKYTAPNLKKLFKCVSVIELSPHDNPKAEAKKITKIEPNTLRRLCYEFVNKDHEDNAFDDGIRPKKMFIFSDDADINSLSFDVIKDDEYRFNSFEIDQDTSEELIDVIDDITQHNYKKQQAHEAKDLYESLSNLEDELSINLVVRYADDELDEAIDDCEQEVQNCRDKVEQLIATKWQPPIKSKTTAKKKSTTM